MDAGQPATCHKNRWIKFFRKWHRWPGVIMAFFFILWAMSGIVMNHRGLFSGLEIGRKYLPGEYRYRNWNNAAIKGAVSLGSDSALVYGNVGVWLTTDDHVTYSDFNAGFPKGIDNRKIFSMLRSESGNLYAGTLFGLFYFDEGDRRWQKLDLPVKDARIQAIIEKDGEILVLTRSFLFRCNDDPARFHAQKTEFPPPQGYDNKVGLFRTIWVIHSGEIYGLAGKLLVDALGLVVILLSVTGAIHFTAPYVMRSLKRQKRPVASVSNARKFSAGWHKKAGIWIALILLINTVTGMFLRPPLLIAIANARVGKIPWSVLDAPNPWEDKLRAILFDEAAGGLLVGTSEGIYFSGEGFHREMVPMPGQPPVSVMGFNVFEHEGHGTFLVGSFSGLYQWAPSKGLAFDLLSGRHAEAASPGRPVGDHLAAGYLVTRSGLAYYFDYNHGAKGIGHDVPFAEMPATMVSSSGMSWWNFALEVHTGRIFKPLTGDFYILIIPIIGIFGTILTISGLIVWIKLYVRKNR